MSDAAAFGRDRAGDMAAEYEAIVTGLPTRAPIFLPTERLPLEQRLAGVRRVKALYDGELDKIYAPQLRALREKHAGQKRCFVIGNGPSLNRTDLEALAGEVSFAVNGFFLKSRKLSWSPTYYIVEDHLVGEDRAHWINRFKGPTKLFPAYLAYCIEPAEDVVFFNHRPRKSYPGGFDFSLQADKITYTGCTVTFTALQIAAYMGFEEIYLIGVDADYDIPKDVEQSKEYGTGVLDMKSADPNHFDPTYFGNGYRWHDPQVDKMVEAYREARKVVSANGQVIYNAGVGGKLDVFERRDFNEVLPHARRPNVVALENDRAEFRVPPASGAGVWTGASSPRVLSFDLTLIGDGTATGEVKKALYRGLSERNLLQVFSRSGRAIALPDAGGHLVEPETARAWDAMVDAFDPTVIVYRPVPGQPALHDVAMRQIKRKKCRLVTWIMDDWPADLEQSDPEQFRSLHSDFKSLVNRSDERLSIGDAMSSAFEERYGLPFTAVANGVDPADWPVPHIAPPGEFVLRYSGSLADNMTLNSVVRVAEAVEMLAREGRRIRFEVRTRPIWLERSGQAFDRLATTHIYTDVLDDDAYRRWMTEADALLLAYNFDERSINYTRYSMANKMPECLASGTPLLVHGPMEQATVAHLASYDAGQLCTKPDMEALKTAIVDLVENPFHRLDLAERGQALAFLRHHIDDMRASLQQALDPDAAARTPDPQEGGHRADRSSATKSKVVELRPATDVRAGVSRDTNAGVDETEVVAHLLSERKGRGHVMFDVGAHHGTSAAYFHKLDWTIHCFEPDPKNRSMLVKRLGKYGNIIIDPRAVSDQPQRGLEFFVSDESTGISGLHAFRSTHRELCKVDATTVAHVVDHRDVRSIDFLKIDVEGFDFAVLRGVPWNRVKPEVIEAEFEDAKTRPLGHTYDNLCQYLKSQGYTVYLSEWHPIIRYGISHDWRRVFRYGTDTPDAEGWGNILAFLDDPGEDKLQQAFNACLRFRSS
jgi:FkbM family methyltransferase